MAHISRIIKNIAYSSIETLPTFFFSQRVLSQDSVAKFLTAKFCHLGFKVLPPNFFRQILRLGFSFPLTKKIRQIPPLRIQGSAAKYFSPDSTIQGIGFHSQIPLFKVQGSTANFFMKFHSLGFRFSSPNLFRQIPLFRFQGSATISFPLDSTIQRLRFCRQFFVGRFHHLGFGFYCQIPP